MSQPQLRPIITASRSERSRDPSPSPRVHSSFISGPFCLSPTSEHPHAQPALTFQKVSLAPAPSAPSSVFACTSTDSEAAQSTNDGYYSPAPRLPRSPSLLSSMFSSQPCSAVPSAATSRNNSTSGMCSTALATPLSPLSPGFSNPHALPLPSHIAFACGTTAKDCKPILRRTGPIQCTSTSTSASEDNGGAGVYRSASTNGLGLALSGTESAGPSAGPSIAAGQGKRCTLKFAVKPCFPEGSFARSSSTGAGCYDSIRSGTGPSRRHRSRSPEPIPEWEEVCTPGLESSDDEGYEEDEEGGFTSDEDELGAFAAQARTNTRHRFAWTSRSGSALGLATPRRRTAVETYCTTDDNAPEPMRGRKISIAAKSTDKCSRHLSPPPRSPSPEYAPPAARSPSARDLCMRRARVQGTGGQTEESCAGGNGTRDTRGWKSDGGFFGSALSHAQAYSSVARSRTAPLDVTGSANAEACGSGGDQVHWQARKASLPTPSLGTCKSILRCAEPVDPLAPPQPLFMATSHSRVASPRAGVTPLSSAASSPKSISIAQYRLPTPLSPISTSCGLVDQSCALAGRTLSGDSSGSGSRGARAGLEEVLSNGRKASMS